MLHIREIDDQEFYVDIKLTAIVLLAKGYHPCEIAEIILNEFGVDIGRVICEHCYLDYSEYEYHE